MGTQSLSEVGKKQSGNIFWTWSRGLSGAELRTIKPRLDAPTSPKGVHVVHQEDAARLHPKPEKASSRLHIEGKRRNWTCFLFVMIRIAFYL